MVCWPKGFQAWQKETFKIPPAERRARLQYHASLYHKPSTIMAINGASGKLLLIGEGLFSRLSYTDNETIVSFCGDLITNEDYERECLAGRGDMLYRLTHGLCLTVTSSSRKANAWEATLTPFKGALFLARRLELRQMQS